MNSRPWTAQGGTLALGILTTSLVFLMLGGGGCRSFAYLDAPPDAGASDAAVDGGQDGGLACSGENPAGCSASTCPEGMVCESSTGVCRPSECACDPSHGQWVCTDDCGGGVCRPSDPQGEITFVLGFMSDTPDADQIFVQTSEGAENTPWIALFDAGGARVRYYGNCVQCTCTGCGGPCPICDMGLPFTEKLLPGEQVTLAWDARVHPDGVCRDGSSCTDDLPLPHGKYLARFCYSGSATGEGAGQWIGDALCDELPFEWRGRAITVEDAVCWCG